MSTSDVVTATVPTITYSSSTSYEIERLTNFGPLTTTYTAPEICQSDPANLGIVAFTITGSNYTTTSYDCRQVENRYIQNPACYPSSSAVQEFQAAALSELYGAYYSPGVICPSAWTTAATGIYPPADTYSSIPAWVDPMIGNRDMSATFVYCCPTGYSLDGHCQSQITTATSGAMCNWNYRCSSSAGSAGSVCASDAEVFDWNPSHTSTSITVGVYAIAMVQQDSDWSSSSTPVSSTSLSTIGLHGAHSSSASRNEPAKGGGSSSSSAKVIVPAVVVPVVVLIAFVAAVIFCLRARKRRARSQAERSSYHNSAGLSQWEKSVTPDTSTFNEDGSSNWQGSNMEPMRR